MMNDRRRGTALILTLSLIAVGAAHAADDAPLFDYRAQSLDNGLRVVTLEDFSCPIVAVHLWYHVGSKDEDPQRQGFAHMFEHMMFRGTDRLGPTDHFDYVRRTGGDCNAYTSWDNTTYIQTLPSNQLELALCLEAERMAFLKIDQNAFDTERKVVEEERRLGLNGPYGTLPEKVVAEVFKEHPYRWLPIGQIPHLRAAAVQELRDFWTRFYVPNNATLVIVGAVKHEDAQNLAKKYFGWIPRYPDPPRVTIREPEPSAARQITIKEDSAPAPIVGIIFRTVPSGHPDEVPLQLLGTILGGGESSRIYRDLVANQQLAVVALAGAFSLEQDGMMAAGALLTPFSRNGKKSIAAINAQIERMRNEAVTADELEKARNQLLKGLITTNLTVASKARALGQAAVIEGDVANVNRRVEQIRAATPADLQRVAQKYLAPQRGMTVNVEQNLLGSIFGKKKEPDAPVSAVPETEPPPPGRAGLVRPADFPASPPVAPPLQNITTPAFTSKTLDNGLKVVVVPNQEVPFVSVQLGLLNGAWTEQKPGTASMALSMLTKGTAKHDEGALAEELDRYAISLGGSAGLDSASVSANCLSDQVERAVNLMAETVLTPAFPVDEFAKLKAQVRTGLAVSESDPKNLADRELRKRIYGSHPYARTETGLVADVDALTPEDCAAWWQANARPDQAVLIFSGQIDAQRAQALAQQVFGDWKAVGPKPPIMMPPIPEAAGTKIYLVDRPGSVQSEIRVGQLGLTRKKPEYFTAQVVSDYFGGAFSSRLNETIRVEKGLTYGAGGGFSAQRFAGRFGVSTFSKTETAVEAVQAVLGEIERLRTQPPTEAELDKTKSYILGSYPGQRETPQDVAEDLWRIEVEGLPQDYYEKMLTSIAVTDAAACVRVVNGIVDPSRLVIVVVGDAEKLRSGLEAIAPVEIVAPEPKAAKPPEAVGDEE